MPEVAVAVVVPVYDNLVTLPAMADELVDALDGTGLDWQVIWVDDASGDGSWPWLLTHCDRSPRQRAIRLDRNHGQSLAVCVGMAHAPPGAVVVTIDADLEYAPEQIASMVAAVVDPWCFVAGVRPRTIDRHWSSAAFNAVARILTGDHVGDVGCGFMAMGPELAASVSASDLRGLALRPYLSGRASTTVRHPVRFEPVGPSTTGPRTRLRIAADVLAADPRPARRLGGVAAVALVLRASGHPSCGAVGLLAALGATGLITRRAMLRRRLGVASPMVVQHAAAADGWDLRAATPP